MGSGEADVRSIKVGTVSPIGDYPNYPYYPTTIGNNVTWSYPTYVYIYQLICPKKSCKETNWAQLDVITECVGCGSKLKAVKEKPDYEVEVSR